MNEVRVRNKTQPLGNESLMLSSFKCMVFHAISPFPVPSLACTDATLSVLFPVLQNVQDQAEGNSGEFKNHI